MYRALKDERGTTSVEFAFAAPVVFLLVLGIMEFWNVNLYRNFATQAAYEASRRGIVPGITAAELQNVALAKMRTVGARGVEVDVEPDVITQETQEVTVTVTVPIAPNAWLIAMFFPQDSIIRRSTVLNSELGSEDNP
jgi:Flp pilus assembly protein TadG